MLTWMASPMSQTGGCANCSKSRKIRWQTGWSRHFAVAQGEQFDTILVVFQLPALIMSVVGEHRFVNSEIGRFRRLEPLSTPAIASRCRNH